LARLLKDSKVHIELHYKLFIETKKGLKMEMKKLNVKSFFEKP
jgi:hypothetical protein